MVRYDGRTYVRIGTSTRLATPQEERILFSRLSVRSMDVQPCRGASLDDLALDLFSEYRRKVISPEIIEENGRNLTDQLSALRFWDHQENVPTYAGIILFGINSRYFLPGNYIQFIQLDADGTPIAGQEISGDLRNMIQRMEQIFEARNLQFLEHSGGFEEIAVKTYPPFSLRELLINAIVHRDYTSNAPVRVSWFPDRIEILNPGGLFGQVNPNNFPRINDYRNPLIAEAAKMYGYVERYGIGVRRATELLLKNGNPAPVFEVADPSYVRVEILARPRP